ncbi:MAG: hypothetical protein AAF320_04140 [Myxococcota bacterium]
MKAHRQRRKTILRKLKTVMVLMFVLCNACNESHGEPTVETEELFQFGPSFGELGKEVSEEDLERFKTTVASCSTKRRISCSLPRNGCTWHSKMIDNNKCRIDCKDIKNETLCRDKSTWHCIWNPSKELCQENGFIAKPARIGTEVNGVNFCTNLHARHMECNDNRNRDKCKLDLESGRCRMKEEVKFTDSRIAAIRKKALTATKEEVESDEECYKYRDDPTECIKLKNCNSENNDYFNDDNGELEDNHTCETRLTLFPTDEIYKRSVIPVCRDKKSKEDCLKDLFCVWVDGNRCGTSKLIYDEIKKDASACWKKLNDHRWNSPTKSPSDYETILEGCINQQE